MIKNQQNINDAAGFLQVTLEKMGYSVPRGVLLAALVSVARDAMARVPHANAASVASRHPKPFESPVPCKLWTQDRKHEVDFDVRSFLSQAPDQQLSAILEGGFSTCEAVDEAANFIRATQDIPQLEDAFAHIDASGMNPGKECVIGYEVMIDAASMLRWLDALRPLVLANFVMSRVNVVEFVKVKDPNWPDPRCGWQSPQDKPTKSFATWPEALLDAYYAKNMLELALKHFA